MIQETELISTVTAILEKELSVALGMSLPLFQLEAKQKQGKDTLRTKMSIKRQEIEKKQRPVSKEIGPGARSACRDAED